MIDSFGFQTELVNNDERIVRSTFNIKLNGYIVPEILQKDIDLIKKKVEDIENTTPSNMWLNDLKELETEEELESIDYQTMAKCYRELGKM